VLEREPEPGGHARLHALLPGRQEYGRIGAWLAEQARNNGAAVRSSSPVTGENLDEVLAAERPDHVVVATGSRICRDGFQGWTGAALPGWESGPCAGWDEVVTGSRPIAGDVVVIDDQGDAAGPLTAVYAADHGAASVTIVTRWPMIAMETILDAYLEWILPQLYERGIRVVCDHAVSEIRDTTLRTRNIHFPRDERELHADLIVMATARQSINGLYPLLRERGVSAEVIGDAVAPRGTYEAVFEGHRQGRKL
jgi:hypothetical protein